MQDVDLKENAKHKMRAMLMDVYEAQVTNGTERDIKTTLLAGCTYIMATKIINDIAKGGERPNIAMIHTDLTQMLNELLKELNEDGATQEHKDEDEGDA